MIPAADITNVTSPLAAESTPVSPPLGSAAVATALTQNAPGILTQMAVGRLLQVQVLTQLKDGSFIVGVDDSALRMSLPEGTTVGSKLQMTLLTDSPRPTFLLEAQTDSNSASLSNAGKIISNVLQSAELASAPNTLVGKTPIVAEPTGNPAQIAASLQGSVEQSGLFYESHVGQWASGELPLATLMQEPQMQGKAQIANAPGESGAKSKAATINGGVVLQRPATSDAELAKLIDDARASADAHSTLGQAIGTLLANARGLPQEVDTVVKPTLITPESAQTIHLQLNVLEQNKYVWHGELWPGQQMEWEIEEDAAHQNPQNPDGGEQAAWNSTVRFQLPSLGKISASIHLSGGRVQMRLATDSAAAASRLQAHGKELADALDGAGSPLDSLLIQQDGKA
jgi:hypothetical protein